MTYGDNQKELYFVFDIHNSERRRYCFQIAIDIYY